MVIVYYFLKLLVLGTQVVRLRVRYSDCPMFNLGQNTSAKVTLFCVLPKYFVIKMHNLSQFVRKTKYLCKFPDKIKVSIR